MIRPLRVTPALVVAGLLGGVATAAGIALTTTSGWLIVRASEGPQIMLLLTAIVAVRTFGLARPVFRHWERLRSHDAALADLARARTQTYADLIPLTPARLGSRGRADVLTGVVDDLTDVVEASVRVTVPVLSALLAGVLTAALTALVDPRVGLVLAGMLLAAAGTAVVADRFESRAQTRLLRARAEVARVAQLTTEHADELRAVSGTGTAAQWLRTAHEELRASVAAQSRGRALTAGAVLVITGAATIACAALAVTSSAGDPVRALLVLAPVALGETLGVLTDATRSLARSRACAQRLEELLGQEPAVIDPAAAAATGAVTVAADPRACAGAGADLLSTTAPRLQLTGVRAGWVPGRTDVGPIDLTVEPGEHIAITGPNGSGKSTLLEVLARHLDPAGGTYRVDGVDVTRAPLADVRDLFAVVDDEPHVLAGSLRANLALAAPGADDAHLVTALRRAGLGAWFDGLADGLDTRLGSGGAGVSGGERTRLAIARAIASERPVILLDEPVAHLDHPTATAVIDDLLTHAMGSSVIMVTHHGTGLHRMDRVVTTAHEGRSGHAEERVLG